MTASGKVARAPGEIVTEELRTLRNYLEGPEGLQGEMDDTGNALKSLAHIDVAAGRLIESAGAVANANANMAMLYVELEEAKEEVEEREQGVRAAHRTIAQMLQHIRQGLLTLDADLCIQPQYSKHLEEILCSCDLAGKGFEQLVLQASELGSDGVGSVVSALSMCFGNNAILAGMNLHVLPAELVWTGPSGSTQTLELEYSVIADDGGCVERIMVCVRDVTEVRKLRAAAARIDREMQMVAAILAHSELSFSRWHTDTTRLLDQLARLAVAKSGEPSEEPPTIDDLKADCLMALHTLKGNARQLGFGPLCDAVHTAEDSSITALDGVHAVTQWPSAVLQGLHEEVKGVAHNYVAVAEARLGRDLSAGAVSRPDGEAWAQIQVLASAAERAADGSAAAALGRLLRAINGVGVDTVADVVARTTLDELARRCGKPTPELHVTGGDLPLDRELSTYVGGALSHVIANAVDHGIELAHERARCGKPARGRIEVTARAVDEHLVLLIGDDGKGIDLVSLRRKHRGGADGRELSNLELAETIFQSGMSTAGEVTQMSGRGVGMAWVKLEAERLGGWARVCALEEQPNPDYLAFRLEIGVPLPLAAQQALPATSAQRMSA